MELIASASPVRRLLAHLDELGIDPRILRSGPVDPRLRRTHGPLRVSARLVVDMMESAAEQTGQADFGLRHAQWLNLRGLDTISLLWDQVGSVAEWYRLAQRYIHLENNALQYDLAIDDGEAALVHGVLAVLRPRATQFTFAFMALTVRVFRTVVGPDWRPLRAEFMCAAPADLSSYRAFFRCDLRFGEARNALVVRRADFERELPGRNREMVSFLEDHLQRQSTSQAASVGDQVAQMLMSETAGRTLVLRQLAERLALSPRTLQRRLASEGTSYGQILDDVRREVAGGHVQRFGRTRLSQLAFELGFSDATAASRFLRSRAKP
jgi:AraC-like DNA-binding protein